ncbi:MAG: dihydroorotase [Candidatus Xiphinematobacter sp.]|nr:MAG: dihydroorotase [Candidatus Xiphinematobacter sp.]
MAWLSERLFSTPAVGDRQSIVEKSLKILNGHVIDPANGVDRVCPVYVKDGRIVSHEPNEAERIDANGLVVAPGLIDIHVHLREPGQSHKETIASGTRAAAAGGFTSVVCMPNTFPSVDNPSTVSWIQERARRTASVNVFCAGAITKGLMGQELAPIGSMAETGIVAITDDGFCVQNHGLMRRAIEYARMFGLPILDHCQDNSLVLGGVINEGEWSVRLGMQGWPSVGEELVVERDILLSELCRHPIHCQHISSAGSVRRIREAQKRKIPISGEVCPHHIFFTDERVAGFDTCFKTNPPIRSEKDIAAILEGISDGTLNILCSDHAPHASFEKEVEFDQAPFGITGLETEFSAFCDLLVHRKRIISLKRLIALYTLYPARLLHLDRGTLSPGAFADITLIDPNLEWTFHKQESLSMSHNTPFDNMTFCGRVVRTLVGGHTVWMLEDNKTS